MLPLHLAIAVSASPATACKLDLEQGETVIERRMLKVRNGTFEAVAVSKADENFGDPASRVLVLGRNCGTIYSQRFQDATKVLFSEGRLGKQPFLFVTAFRPGGLGAGFSHALLALGGQMFAEDGVQPLAPVSLNQGNMDGIFVGDLGRGRGAGPHDVERAMERPGSAL